MNTTACGRRTDLSKLGIKITSGAILFGDSTLNGIQYRLRGL